MKIVYLLESTGCWGGVKNVFDQARVLESRGHEVLIRAKAGTHDWYPAPLRVEYVGDLGRPLSPGEKGPDVVTATFWTTVRPALAFGEARLFHLCQGYEGGIAEYAARREEIEAAYRVPIPKITNGKWLNDVLEEIFGRDLFPLHVVPPIVDTSLFCPAVKKSAGKQRGGARVLIVGTFGISVKAVEVALAAASSLKKQDPDIRTVRVSPVDRESAERAAFPIDEYQTGLRPGEMAEAYRTSDLFFSASRSAEGFGLPFAEALACGVPAVVTDIPPHKSHDENPDYALFVPEDDPEGMAAAGARILADADLRKTLSEKGPGIIERKYGGERIGEILEGVFRGGASITGSRTRRERA